MRKGKTRLVKRFKRWQLILSGMVLYWFILEGRFYFPKFPRPPKGGQAVEVEMKTTSYCHCRKCCSYRWFLFIPFQKTGMFSFRLKQIGKTSSGKTARPGTLAADTSLYPYGTVMYIRVWLRGG